MSKKKKKKKQVSAKCAEKIVESMKRPVMVPDDRGVISPNGVTTDVILILYGDRRDLDRCITSVKKHCMGYKLHIIDNNEVNRGFTKAVNEGILAGDAPYVWLLNQDAVVLERAQEALIDRFMYSNRVGVVGSMQIDPKDHDIIRHGGTAQAFPNGVHKGGRISMGHCRIPEKQTWVNFASVMFRREMIRHIGVLDENMFLLYSDSDYCYWARHRGWEVWYEPKSRVLHRLGSASKDISEWHRKDMISFMDKWGISYDGSRKSETFKKLDTYP